MHAKLGLAMLLVLTVAVEASAASPRFVGRIRFARGGTSMYRRALQNNQAQTTQQLKVLEKIAEQERAEAAAEAKRQREVQEAGAAANREIKQREQERGEHERQRQAETVGSSGSSSGTSGASKLSSSPKAGKSQSTTTAPVSDKPAKK